MLTLATLAAYDPRFLAVDNSHWLGTIILSLHCFTCSRALLRLQQGSELGEFCEILYNLPSFYLENQAKLTKINGIAKLIIFFSSSWTRFFNCWLYCIFNWATESLKNLPKRHGSPFSYSIRKHFHLNFEIEIFSAQSCFLMWLSWKLLIGW